MNFEFATATRILFGRGKIREIGALAAGMGRRALVVTGKMSERSEALVGSLRARGIETVLWPASGEPSIAAVLEGGRAARNAVCDMVVACGGGSIMDTGKAIAALLTNPGDPMDYVEVVGRGLPLTRPSAPCICVPTTAGTGSEVTRNAVLASPAHKVKVSLRSPLMLPRLALIDPELTHSMPAELTAATGLDALTQLIEPFVCNSPTPLSDAICREGMRSAALYLRRAWEHGSDAEAREGMALASLCGGLALANAKLGAVHGLAAPLGGMFPAPHGAVCARLLPIVMDANIRTLRTMAAGSTALSRYEEVSRILTGKQTAIADEGVEWVRALCAELSVQPLARYGVTEESLPALAAQAARSSSMRGNPIELSADELRRILSEGL